MLSWLRRLLANRRAPSNLPLGRRGEDLAAEFYQRQGGRILARNWRFRSGELDLVVLLERTIVFVEVKTRIGAATDDPTENVTRAKQKKLFETAVAYLKRQGWLDRPTRFDVVAILWDEQHPVLRHYPHAITPPANGQFFG